MGCGCTATRQLQWLLNKAAVSALFASLYLRAPTKDEAIRFESFVIAEISSGKPWNPEQDDSHLLSELIELIEGWNNYQDMMLAMNEVNG